MDKFRGFHKCQDTDIETPTQGAVSVSMSLHQTSFCFVCTHLTSGHKEGDELRRNTDIADIFRRTTFPRLVKLSAMQLPETIMAHE